MLANFFFLLPFGSLGTDITLPHVNREANNLLENQSFLPLNHYKVHLVYFTILRLNSDF